VIGIVYPVYYNDLPAIVSEFAGKLRDIGGRYIFAVCNYGGCGSQSVKSLAEILQTAGGTLSASWGIHMPQNAFSKPWENNVRLVEKASRRAEKIAEDIKARKKGDHLKGLLNAVFLRLHPKLLPRIRADLSKRTGLPPKTALNALIRANDRRLSAGPLCAGCGLCERVCPVGNIEMDGGRPKWLGHCENCLACYDWCPSHAIGGAVAHEGYFYRNPRISAAEIIAQRDSAR
jgi:ferredoxin